MSRPLKRHPALQPLSREHHQILLLGFKLRQGFKNNIEPERMLMYCQWFLKSYLEPHFEKEEFHFKHCLGEDSDIYKDLREQHQQIIHSMSNLEPDVSALRSFEKLIVSHIRHEEREVFEKAQVLFTPEDLLYLKTNLKEQKFIEQVDDLFWL